MQMIPRHQVECPQLPEIPIIDKKKLVAGVGVHGADNLQVLQNRCSFRWISLCVNSNENQKHIGLLVDGGHVWVAWSLTFTKVLLVAGSNMNVVSYVVSPTSGSRSTCCLAQIFAFIYLYFWI